MIDATFPSLRDRHRRANAETLAQEWGVQQEVVKSRHGTGLILLPQSYDARLAGALAGNSTAAATDAGRTVARHFGGTIDPDGMAGWLDAGAQAAAAGINDSTRALLDGLSLDEIDDVFANLADVHADLYGFDLAAGAVNFGAHEGARAGGAEGKLWQVNSGNPRSQHVLLSGQAAPVDGTFSNGMRFPKDPSGGASAAQIANCQCSVTYV